MWVAVHAACGAAIDMVVLVSMGIMTRIYFLSHRSWFPHGRMSFLWGVGIQVVLIAHMVAAQGAS